MQFKGVFFDFDYTLGDSTPAILAGFRHAFSQMGLPEPEDEAVRRTIGMVLEDEYTVLSGDADPGRRARFRQLYAEKAGPLQPKLTKLFPGARALLEALHRAGLPAGVVSTKNASTLRAILEAQGVLPLLASVTGGDMVSRPKPDPEGLCSAVRAQALEPEQVLYCGDTLIDAETAQRAGAPFCAVLNGATAEEQFRASGFPFVHIAPDLAELKEWLGI